MSLDVYTAHLESGETLVFIEQAGPAGHVSIELPRDDARKLAEQIRRTAGPPSPLPMGPPHLRLVVDNRRPS